VCFADYDRDLPLVVERRDPATSARELLAIGRLGKLRWADGEGEFALVVSDRWQRHGLGTELLRRLVDIARCEGLRLLRAEMLPENVAMQRLSKRLGFALEHDTDEQVVRATLTL
jgi:acetyltransferase